MPRKAAEIIAEELKLRPDQVTRTLELFAGGATLPFIARYRKEVTGNLDEVQLGQIQERGVYLEELEARKKTVLAEIVGQGKLTPELQAAIDATLSKTELEDLYLPYKPKRRTRATIARERGLEPLALRILAQAPTEPPADELAAPHLSAEVPDTAAAFAGARDILAELISERADVRADLREQALASGTLVAAVIPGQEGTGVKFKDYFNIREQVHEMPAHRVLAIRRGEKEGFLRVELEVPAEEALARVRRRVVSGPRAALAAELERAVADAYERLLQPSIEADVRLQLKERADGEAIRVFAENLRNLLLQAPFGARRVLALDPGFRTGCKLVVIDEKGDLLANTVIYPDRHQAQAAETVSGLARTHRVDAVAVGNGTGSRETEAFLRNLKGQGKLGDAIVVVVNEAGASVYSASEVARDELPDHDVTVRGAVSIGRRLQDPLAELVKIDPKSIGVGQYQHDVHQPTLKKALDGVVERCVNGVGVDLNTASAKLLQYVAGVGETLARNIVAHRAQNGRFRSRKQLLDVPRFGPKAFEQAAGFLRVRDGDNPLDNSAVHPESYDVVAKMAADLGVNVKGLVGNKELAKRIDPQTYVDGRRGLLTLKDILGELEKPGRDPRAEFEEVGFNPEVTEFEHVREGMVLRGVVTNVTQFGAFVDIGVHQDGLVHVSELSHRFVKDPAEVVKVGDRVQVKVLKVDAERRRIGLTMKLTAERPPQPPPPKPRKPDKPGKPEPPHKRPFNNPFQAALGGLRKDK